ncbi:DUF4190 domain-containing protein [Nocardia sp. 2]|uniref:DUF4190 domain-containing protein n=1 Tax=Nocardia acididurans TaxID=2802282 RepID=A0ABS1M7Y2_9NOCA|nr:DUF4190 domain-containing protein [Nocardia acididurans]MBL1075263.1 DUF4190 domain-containing protein [Nocardia acididurans]
MYPNNEPPQGVPGQQPPYGAPGYPMPPAYPMGAPQSQKTNGFAIASFVLSFLTLCGAVLAIPFGVIALSQIKQRGERGKGLAIAGLVIAGLWILLVAAAVLINLVVPDQPGTKSVGSVKVGDCIADISESQLVYSTKTVPCDQPHDAEVFYQFDLSGGWPGADEVMAKADSTCTSKLEALYGNSPKLGQLSPFMLYPPDERNFKKSREVTCMLVMTDDSKLTGKVPR